MRDLHCFERASFSAVLEHSQSRLCSGIFVLIRTAAWPTYTGDGEGAYAQGWWDLRGMHLLEFSLSPAHRPARAGGITSERVISGWVVVDSIQRNANEVFKAETTCLWWSESKTSNSPALSTSPRTTTAEKYCQTGSLGLHASSHKFWTSISLSVHAAERPSGSSTFRTSLTSRYYAGPRPSLAIPI